MVLHFGNCRGLLPFFATEEFSSSLPKLFILPTYTKDKARTMVSPPRIKNKLGYDLAIINYLDDEVFA
jgi:hypothetical protein